MQVPDVGFGSCACGARFASRLVEVNMHVYDERVSIADVPQGACPACGSRVYGGGRLELLEAEIRGLTAPAPASRY